MGANFISNTLPGNLSQAEVRKAFDDAQANCRHENGHSYSGGIGMASGLEFTNQTFETEGEAADYTENTAEKWDAALCSRVKAKPDDVGVWFIGAWCAS
jgi:hypothetical protein